MAVAMQISGSIVSARPTTCKLSISTLRKGSLTSPAARPGQIRRLRTQAVSEEKKPEIAKFSDSIGLPTEEGLFGFKPFPEVWVGRLAMAGFISSCVQEFSTGKGTLQQVGLLTPNPLLLTVILTIASGAIVFATGRTISRAQTGDMSRAELSRYGKFLGIQNEAGEIADTETEMKKNWNKESSSDSPPQPLVESKSDNPTDTFQAERQSSPVPVSVPADNQFADAGMRYARDVEVTNGRAAMLGFYAATVIEAWTGKGILSQCIWYLKLVHILGPASGF